jgi:GT2 family glycosyltransferase
MDLSVIIVEYLDLESLEKAIRSIYSHISNLGVEVIVVSNSAYPIEKQVQIRSKFNETQFTFNQDNLGFAQAVNQGINVSSGEFIMLLNPDARLLDGSVQGAVEFMVENDNIAVVGPMTLKGNGQLHDTCRRFMSPGLLVARTIKRLLSIGKETVLEDMDYSKIQKVDWVSGGCLIARKSAINKSGLMDERYFMYMEDMDWCRRFWQDGFEVWYLPEWKIEHIGGKASTKNFSISNKLMWIHLISYFKYYFKWLHLKLPF